MKQVFNLPGQSTVPPRRHLATAAANACLLLLVLTGCSKELNKNENELPAANAKSMLSEMNVVNTYQGLDAQTAWELQQARAASARYRHIENALKDGYADIEVVIENMGHHFLKADNLDASFDVRKPEILVYDKKADGSYELVAVEYAVPISLSATAPAGFTGSGDVWTRNDGFGLWLLHAWVWHHNPAGVFNATNATVHIHD